MPDKIDLPSWSRALVPLIKLAPYNEQEHGRPARRAANFLTQLIAAQQKLPQAREKRRADPAEVIAAYRATVERIKQLNGR